MTKRPIKILCFVLAILIPILFVFGVGIVCSATYENTYYYGLQIQYDRLTSVKEKKIVVVGGSSVAFGMDSDLLASLLQQEVVSFGLYGALGTKVMLDLSKQGLNKGDTVVIAPELIAEAFSTFFGADAFLKSAEGRFDILTKADFENYDELFGATFNYAQTKVGYALAGTKLDPTDVYRFSAIDENGEIKKGIRQGNVLPTGYQSEKVVSQKEQISQDFINYVNDYVSWCNLRGINVYFSFGPINEKAVIAQGIDQRDFENLYLYLAQNLSCEVISNPNDYVYDYRYFYDTNYHLNDSGVVLRTAQLAKDVKLALKDLTKTQVELPEPPESLFAQHEIDTTLNYTSEDCFVFEELENGTYAIVGTTERSQVLSEIVIPVIVNDKYVTNVNMGAFSECSALREITIPLGIAQISGGAFANCTNLERIVILATRPNDLLVDRMLLDGTNDNCKLVFKKGYKSAFSTNYIWQFFGDRMIEQE